MGNCAGIQFKNVRIGWKKEEPILKEVSFEFKSNEKVAILGKVGSGKTSLLLSILGEIPADGEMAHNGKISFAE